jgi:hypothetical protein
MQVGGTFQRSFCIILHSLFFFGVLFVLQSEFGGRGPHGGAQIRTVVSHVMMVAAAGAVMGTEMMKALVAVGQMATMQVGGRGGAGGRFACPLWLVL